VRILVVDDDAAVRRSIDRALRLEGYDVVTVPSGGEALEALAQAPPDALILDLGLPDLDGLEVCKRIRTWSEVPIIVLSADGSENRKVDALEHGADDYMTKPFGMREMHPGCRSRCATTGPTALRNARHSLTSAPCISTSCTARPPTTAGRSTSRLGNSTSWPFWPATPGRSARAG
jgi:DNA-binding response OmpR family regulator